VATKPESNFIKRIHRKMNQEIYKQAMGLTATNGTPDYYYEGDNGTLWVEYKWYDKEPAQVRLFDTTTKPHLSKLQQTWLKRATNNGVKIAVVAGFPGGCFILYGNEWELTWSSKGAKFYTIKFTESDWVEELNDLIGSS